MYSLVGNPEDRKHILSIFFLSTRRISSVGSDVARDASDTKLIPVSGTFFCEDLVMKNISTAIFPLRLIQGEQLSVNGKRIFTKYR